MNTINDLTIIINIVSLKASNHVTALFRDNIWCSVDTRTSQEPGNMGDSKTELDTWLLKEYERIL